MYFHYFSAHAIPLPSKTMQKRTSYKPIRFNLYFLRQSSFFEEGFSSIPITLSTGNANAMPCAGVDVPTEP